MENRDLELGVMENMIPERVKLFLDRVEKEHNLNEQITPSIRRAPRTLRVLSSWSFSPRVVSIGPLHRDNKKVKAFERQKATYLTNLMNHITSSTPGVIMNSCMEKVYASMKKIKACYVLTKKYDDVEFAEMMVMDACFILGFIHQTFKLKSADMFHAEDVVCDLVLLENQIPFFFLEEIFKCTIAKLMPNTSLVVFMHPVLSILNLFNSDVDLNILKNISVDDTHHILSLLHECYKPQFSSKPQKNEIILKEFSSKPQKNEIILKEFSITKPHSAVDLDKAGVKFKPNRSPTWVLGMKMEFPCFLWSWCKCTLRMPIFYVTDFTEVTLRNLLAYEELRQTHDYITSYAFVINMLVNTQDDVAKLVDSEVLVNVMGSNEEVAKMINKICKELAVVNSLYRQQWKTLDEYYNSYWPKHIGWMRRTYFSSPWNIIALIVGSIIFALTIVQAIFTIGDEK
ncbi:hypothetical protein E3N88_31681 [Mikania micrantha]|uniref:Uncharacterized protein n=1 Tax=Mikania micrantha TaxID=192012 RepID=A0A5N6M6N4_9ASTR|nr:hypothetical protein E3N88_31681 [Mikania micrantha]